MPTEVEKQEHEEELQRRLGLLKEALEEGRIKICASQKEAVDAIMRVRVKPDGTVDLNTVDGSVRALSLVATVEHDRRKMKEQFPLREIQQEYFGLLDQFFGQPYAEMKKHKVTSRDIASHLVSQEGFVKAFTKDKEKFREMLTVFWETYGPAVRAHLEDLDALKSVYGGSLFPTANIACSVGLYMDTIVLPDPLAKIGRAHV